jgi:hypothetical protein
MTVLAEHHVHFVVEPAADGTANIVLVSGDRRIAGYVVSWMGFLYAGDKGQLSAMRFLAEEAPARVASLIEHTLRTGWTFYLNRTLVTTGEIVDAFRIEADAVERIAA